MNGLRQNSRSVAQVADTSRVPSLSSDPDRPVFPVWDSSPDMNSRLFSKRFQAFLKV
jgi:hypothetical protein